MLFLVLSKNCFISVEEVKEKPPTPEVKEELPKEEEPEEKSGSGGEEEEESESESESESDDEDLKHMTDAERKRAKAVSRIQVYNFQSVQPMSKLIPFYHRNEGWMPKRTEVLISCELLLFVS